MIEEDCVPMNDIFPSWKLSHNVHFGEPGVLDAAV